MIEATTRKPSLMKIVHLIAYFHPYLKYQENHLVEEQVKEGHEVHVITSNINFNFADYDKTMLPVIGTRRKKTGSFKLNGYCLYYLPTYFDVSGRVLLKGYLRLVNSLNPNIIIAHGITQLHTLGIVYSNIQAKIIVDEHVLYSDIASSNIRKLFYYLWGKFFSKRIQRRTSKIVAISYGVHKLLTTLMKIKEEKIQLISLGADSNTFYPDKEVGDTFRKHYKIPLDAIVIGYTGKIGEYKKVHLLLHIVNEIGFEKLHILVVGNIMSSYKVFFERSVTSSKVPVTLLQALPPQKLNAVYNACDIVAWPANQTISTVDASSCGKPIICSDFLVERFSSGQGIGIKAGNADSLKKALFCLINDKDLRNKIHKKPFGYVLQKYTLIPQQLKSTLIKVVCYTAFSSLEETEGCALYYIK